MYEARVIDNVLRAWRDDVAPEVKPNACILAARLLSQALPALGVECRIQPVTAMVCNSKWFQDLTKPLEERDDDEWAVGTAADPTGQGFGGHLVVWTENYYVDLTIGQFERPQHKIVTGDALVRPKKTMEMKMGGKGVVVLPSGLYMVWPLDDHSYKKSVDWRTTWFHFYPRFMDRVSRGLLGAKRP